MLTPPAYGFSDEEYESRTTRAQHLMRQSKLDALLLTTEPEFRYFSGFRTLFWQSPARPWFLIVPADGKPVAVIPEIGAPSMAGTWVGDITTWPSPRPIDEGISEVVNSLNSVKKTFGRVGIPMGPETIIRMPFSDIERLMHEVNGIEMVDSSPLIRKLRMVKSEAEIEKIRFICGCVSKSFNDMHKIAKLGDREREIFRKFRMDILSRGADEVPYLVGGSGPAGPTDIIGMPSDRTLENGDVLMMDTGSVFDGYYSDFDRNFAFGEVDDVVHHAYSTVYNATEVGIKAARPGITAEKLWMEMAKVLQEGGSKDNTVGRLGHGLGMQLTEWPSNMGGDKTVLKPGMVITLEPCMSFGAHRIMVHEENIVIRDGPAELLSDRAPQEIPVLY
ncbi:MAG: peptidase M24 [Rhodospirillaceae bacterium]|nr:peptidase M24 [Rhodospirillaceae bacterium]